MEIDAKKPNAQKWTADRVNVYLDKIEQAVDGEEYCFFLGRTLARLGLGRHVWSYWKQILADNDDVIERMYFIETKFESKLLTAGLKKVLPARIVISTLKCVYGWKASEAGM